jgi:hypothetical protein
VAGDLAAQSRGKDGMTADDILEHLPSAVQMLRNGIDPDLLKDYILPIVH